jgi:hypothetical protein
MTTRMTLHIPDLNDAEGRGAHLSFRVSIRSARQLLV